ncbi:MAG TPA: hypothetical protein DDW17_01740 [Deltaproteobacteria bacterium]|nr:hypothetical protein [Deltaproteobacteria bacterium]
MILKYVKLVNYFIFCLDIGFMDLLFYAQATLKQDNTQVKYHEAVKIFKRNQNEVRRNRI